MQKMSKQSHLRKHTPPPQGGIIACRAPLSRGEFEYCFVEQKSIWQKGHLNLVNCLQTTLQVPSREGK